jgi:hypothetical protein
MSFDEAIELASRGERFKATVYAMNTLLIHKGVYTQSEFEKRFAEWIEEEHQQSANQPTTSRASFVPS